MKRKRRILNLLLAICLTIGLIPMTTFADNSGTSAIIMPETTDYRCATCTRKDGGYNTTPIQWTITTWNRQSIEQNYYDGFHAGIYACERCGTTQPMMLGQHDFVKMQDKVEPTCTESGYTEGKWCNYCGYVVEYPAVINPSGHTISEVSYKAPTCTETGYEKHFQCTLCEKIFSDVDGNNEINIESITIAIIDHDWDVWQSNRDGTHIRICSNCLEPQTENCSGGTATCITPAVCEICKQTYGVVNPDNHTGEAVWTQTETTHSRAYDCCGAVVIAEEAHEWANGECSECGYVCQHSGGEATCANKAVCDICGEEYGEINASNHTNLVKTEAKSATHMTEGNIEYWYCNGCDKYFSDEAGTKEITLEDTVIPKLTEHTADGTGWHSDETNHWNTCECGEKLNETAHTFEWVIDKEATATEAGSRHEQCKICGYAKAAVEIPAMGTTTDPTKPNNPNDTGKPADTTKPDGKADSTSPQTGDNSNIALWIAVMLAAGAILTGTAVYSRKRKYNR